MVSNENCNLDCSIGYVSEYARKCAACLLMCQIQRTRVSEKADAWANIAKINNVSAWPCESRRQATNARVDTMARKVHIDLAWSSRGR